MKFNEVYNPQKMMAKNLAKGIDSNTYNKPQRFHSSIKIAVVESITDESYIE